jgi:hypothetical protein
MARNANFTTEDGDKTVLAVLDEKMNYLAAS